MQFTRVNNLISLSLSLRVFSILCTMRASNNQLGDFESTTSLSLSLSLCPSRLNLHTLTKLAPPSVFCALLTFKLIQIIYSLTIYISQRMSITKISPYFLSTSSNHFTKTTQTPLSLSLSLSAFRNLQYSTSLINIITPPPPYPPKNPEEINVRNKLIAVIRMILLRLSYCSII